MVKIKHLKPTLREKKRYLAFEIISRREGKKELFLKVNRRIKQDLGLFDAAAAGVMPVKFDSTTKRGIIKMGHKYVNKARVSLMLMSNFEEEDEEFLVKTLGTSGNINALERKYFAS